jgi:hypothetical protein
MHRRKATWFEGGIAKLLAYEKLDKSLNRGFLNLLRGPSFVSWKPNFQVLFIIIKVAKWNFFFIINKFNLIFLKIHLLILYRIHFSEIRKIIKNILLFVNYIKFGPQYFWLLYIYIYIFSISSLKIWFLYQFWSLFFWLLFVFFLILLLIKFFYLSYLISIFLIAIYFIWNNLWNIFFLIS